MNRYHYLFIFICLPFLSGAQSVSCFGPAKNLSAPVRKHLKSGLTAGLDLEKIQQIYRQSPSSLVLKLPFPEGERELKFQSSDIHAAGFQVLDAKNRPVSGLQYPLHFKGMFNSRGKEMAALTLFSNGHLAMVYSSPAGNYNVSRLPDSLGNTGDYLLFFDHDLIRKNPFSCQSESLPIPPKDKRKKGPSLTQTENDTACKLTEIYWECDYDMFQKGGNSIQGALNSFEAMFNGTATLFEVENINIGVKMVKVWDEPDPYNYSSSFTALDDFGSAGNAANWPGQLAHLLSTRNLNLGGVAYLNAICTSFRYGFSNIDFSFPPLFTYSWTLSTIAHELGHNFSSPHTHNCNWEVQPGVFQQIDSCWNAEGGCQPVVRGRVGTIMSYCHLTGSVNLSLGFGPLPGNRIREAFNNMSCVSGTIVIPNFVPVNSGAFCFGDTIELSAEDLPGFNYKWTGPNGFESNSRIALIPNATPAIEGSYGLKVKKAACESRSKTTFLEFNCMKVGQTPQTICAGSGINVPFSSSGVFNPGNRFILQLSNSSGSFVSPLSLDTLDAAVPQTVVTTLPAELGLGNNYRFRFLSTNPAYEGKPRTKGFVINPVGVSPSPQNGERCGPGSVQIGVGGGSGIAWFENQSVTEPISLSRRFNTPVLTQSRSYFAQSGSVSRSVAGPAVSLASGPSQIDNGVIFNSLGTIRIDSLTLVHSPAGGNLCRIRLEKDGQILFSKTIQAQSGGNTRVALFWRADPGNDYRLICDNIQVPVSGAGSGWGSYPQTVNSVISFTGPVSGSTSVFPYFFNMVISRYLSCPSPRVEVQAKINPGTVPMQPSVQMATGDSLICTVPALQYEWQVNGQLVANYNFPKIKGVNNSSYIVRIRIDSCWSEWSAPMVFTLTDVDDLSFSAAPSVYPSPAGDIIWVESGSEKCRIDWYHISGQKIWENEVSGKQNFSVRTFPKGIYFLKWKSQNRGGVLKWVKD